jgi:hypothetical protein
MGNGRPRFSGDAFADDDTSVAGDALCEGWAVADMTGE